MFEITQDPQFIKDYAIFKREHSDLIPELSNIRRPTNEQLQGN